MVTRIVIIKCNLGNKYKKKRILGPDLEVSRGAAAQSVTVKPTGCGSSLQQMKYLLKFIFLRSGVEAKRGVEFCLSIRNTSRS